MRSMLAPALLAFFALFLSGCASRLPTAPAVADTAPEAETPTKARELIVHALALLGTPYRYGGSSPETGFDCSGLVRHVARKAAGLQLPADAKSISDYGMPVDAGDIRPGDLVFFNTLRRPYSHVGIYLGNERFIHAPSSGGVVEVVNMTHRYWRSRYNGARRLPL